MRVTRTRATHWDPYPKLTGTRTRERGYGLYAGVGAGTVRVTHG
jgi:hypothetical protein